MTGTEIRNRKQFYTSLMVFSAIFWGAPWIFIKQSLAEIEVYPFLFLRFTIGLLILCGLFFKRLKLITPYLFWRAAMLGVILFSLYALQTIGLQYTTATNSAFITGLYTVIVPLISVVMYRKWVRWNISVGICLAVIGMYFLTSGSLSGFNFGDFLTLLCAFCAALHIVLLGRYAENTDPILSVIIQVAVVMLLSGGVTFSMDLYPKTISPFVWQTLFLTAAMSTVIAFLLQVYAQKEVDPTRTGLILVGEPLSATLVAVIVGNEILEWVSYFGAGLMVFGIIFAELRPYRLLRFMVRRGI